ncbi:MAG: hypothetical protein IT436_17880 [Phycisphaerales bacterium]|nr:hypothetical protein [Phycisphaerales bacterium]
MDDAAKITPAIRGRLTLDESGKITHAWWPEFELYLPMRWREEPIPSGIELRCEELPDQLIIRRLLAMGTDMTLMIAEVERTQLTAIREACNGSLMLSEPRTTVEPGGLISRSIFGVSEAQNVQFAVMKRGQSGAVLDLSLYRYTLKELPVTFEKWAEVILTSTRLLGLLDIARSRPGR